MAIYYGRTPIAGKNLNIPRTAKILRKFMIEPKIGEIRMLARTLTLPQMATSFTSSGGVWQLKSGLAKDPLKRDFDGWVYADGSKFRKVDFPYAWSFFTEGRTSTTFTVPSVSGFAKMQSSAALESVAYSHPVYSHTHDLTGNIESDITLPNALSVVESDKFGDINAISTINGLTLPVIHQGYNPYDVSYFDFSQDSPVKNISPYMANITVTADKFLNSPTANTGTTTEAYPEHDIIPAMVYIGCHDNMTARKICSKSGCGAVIPGIEYDTKYWTCPSCGTEYSIYL